jgi:hypothetical protein
MNQLTPNAAWLEAARATDDPAGDLISDMRRDLARDPATFPRLFPNIESMRGYLRSKGACREALQAVPTLWRRYRAWLDRHPFCIAELNERRNLTDAQRWAADDAEDERNGWGDTRRRIQTAFAER